MNISDIGLVVVYGAPDSINQLSQLHKDTYFFYACVIYYCLCRFVVELDGGGECSAHAHVFLR